MASVAESAATSFDGARRVGLLVRGADDAALACDVGGYFGVDGWKGLAHIGEGGGGFRRECDCVLA